MRALVLAVVVCATGCNAILGLDRTHKGSDDAAVGDDAIDAAADGAPGTPDGPNADCRPVGHDEDGDGVDDACDDCPAIADTPQADGDHDGVGDACDPYPSLAGDVIVVFDSFATAGDPDLAVVRGTWSLSADAYAQADVTQASGEIHRAVPLVNGTAPVDVTIELHATIGAINPAGAMEKPANRGVGVWFASSGYSSAGVPNGYLCRVLGDVSTTTPNLTLEEDAIQSGSIAILGTTTAAVDLPVDQPIVIRGHRTTAVDAYCHAEASGIARDVGGPDARFATGDVGVQTQGVAMLIQSIVVYAR